jgi:hypothetical protein
LTFPRIPSKIKNMRATVTQTRKISSDQRRKQGRSLVYIESPFDKIADEFASQYGIFCLQFKCKAWSQVCRMATKNAVQALKEIFPNALEIKFSSKAGCSCGCSPGYVVKENTNDYGKNHWVTIEATDEEIASFKETIYNSKIVSKLNAEIVAFNLTQNPD